MQVEKHPPRSQTQKDQEALNSQLASIEEATVKHTALMETRRRQLALLLHEVDHLKKTALDTEEELAGMSEAGAGGGDAVMAGTE